MLQTSVICTRLMAFACNVLCQGLLLGLSIKREAGFADSQAELIFYPPQSQTKLEQPLSNEPQTSV